MALTGERNLVEADGVLICSVRAHAAAPSCESSSSETDEAASGLGILKAPRSEEGVNGLWSGLSGLRGVSPALTPVVLLVAGVEGGSGSVKPKEEVDAGAASSVDADADGDVDADVDSDGLAEVAVFSGERKGLCSALSRRRRLCRGPDMACGSGAARH